MRVAALQGAAHPIESNFGVSVSQKTQRWNSREWDLNHRPLFIGDWLLALLRATVIAKKKKME